MKHYFAEAGKKAQRKQFMLSFESLNNRKPTAEEIKEFEGRSVA